MRPVIILIAVIVVCAAGAQSQDVVPPPPDSTLPVTPEDIPADSAAIELDSLAAMVATIPDLPPLPPPTRLLDSLIRYFMSGPYTFDIETSDLYPREAAGLLRHSASFYSLPHHETPLRTTLAPYGLPGAQLTVYSGPNQLRPFDRVIPADGRIDFNDIATGDIVSAGVVEGPLSAYDTPDGGVAMLYLKPQEIREGPATSEFIVERGAFGYAYTRGRIARRFSEKLGFSFSTDYRAGQGFNPEADDDSYNVKARVTSRLRRATTLDFYANVYRRQGGFPVMPDSGGFAFRRIRRDQQLVASLTRQNILGGQMTARANYQSSRSAYSSLSTQFFRTVKPHYYFGDLSYLTVRSSGTYELAVRAGKDKYDIGSIYVSRDYGTVSLSGLLDGLGGHIFFLARMKASEGDAPAIEAAIGVAHDVKERWRSRLSAGFVTRNPDPTERFTPERSERIGSLGSLAGNFSEHGTPGLRPERRLTANAALAYAATGGGLSLSVNGGLLANAVYYDRRFEVYPAGEVFPANDTVRFADVNVSAHLDRLGPFFARTSLTARTVDSDRYGTRPPYSPRWQVYGMLGLQHFITRLEINLRLFGEMTYCDPPLSYHLEELDNAAMITGGVNASMHGFTFYYQMHNALNQVESVPEGYGYTGWFYSWGINWKFLD